MAGIIKKLTQLKTNKEKEEDEANRITQAKRLETEKVFSNLLRKEGKVTGVSKTFIEIDNSLSVNKTKLDASITDNPKVGDVVIYEYEELHHGMENVVKITGLNVPLSQVPEISEEFSDILQFTSCIESFEMAIKNVEVYKSDIETNPVPAVSPSPKSISPLPALVSAKHDLKIQKNNKSDASNPLLGIPLLPLSSKNEETIKEKNHVQQIDTLNNDVLNNSLEIDCHVSRARGRSRNSTPAKPLPPTQTETSQTKTERINKDIRTLDGSVRKIEGINLIVYLNDQEHVIDTEELKEPLNFTPSTGDIVDVKINKLDDDDIVYISVVPSKTKTGSGQIKSIYDNFGLIENEVVFEVKDKDISVGDVVKYTAIESLQQYKDIDYNWRCTEMALENKFKVTDDDIEEDKVSVLPSSLQINMEGLGETQIIPLVVINNQTKPCTIQKIAVDRRKPESQIELLELKKNEKRIEPKERCIVNIKVTSKFYGHQKEIIKIQFNQFRINISVSINIVDPKGLAPSIGTGPAYKNHMYSKKIRDYMRHNRSFIPGEKVTQSPRFIQNSIKQFEIPKDLEDLVFSEKTRGETFKSLYELYRFMQEPISITNYQERFHVLLWLEELQYFHNMRAYDRDRVTFSKDVDDLILRMEGALDRRPQLMIGDSVRATKWQPNVAVENANYFVGHIAKVNPDNIHLKFGREFFEKYDFEAMSVVFSFSRTNFRKDHEAVDRVFEKYNSAFFFPTVVVPREPKIRFVLENDLLRIENSTKTFPFFNKKLNEQQKMAVTQVLRNETKAHPYIIFGPPGTGKTVTLVEAILQTLVHYPESKIIVASSSNTSANHILRSLIESKRLKKDNMIRITSYNLIEREMIPEDLHSFVTTISIARSDTMAHEENKIHKTGIRLQMSLQKALKHNVIIGTCSSLGALMYTDLKENTFTHVFIDEAGQLNEPDILIPLTLINPDKGQIVFAGDPQQLGPVVLSHYAGKLGLKVSFLYRLMQMDIYKRDTLTNQFDPKLVTQLVYNYRSIPSIMTVYNRMFYNETLVPMIDRDSDEIKLLKSVQAALQDNHYTGKADTIGVHFIPGNGICKQDVNSPSYANPVEVKTIKMVFTRLLAQGVDPKDVGIITPYQLQVRELKYMIKQCHLKVEPRIGTVEEFQGMERKIILISTVRTKFRSSNERAQVLGFISEPARVNVTMSRARALVIIFGHRETLSRDPHWLAIMTYCVENGTYHGDPKDILEANTALQSQSNCLDDMD